jgi:hypothetical protein
MAENLVLAPSGPSDANGRPVGSIGASGAVAPRELLARDVRILPQAAERSDAAK